MFSNLTAVWLSGQGAQYLQSVGPGFKSYSLDFFFFTQYSTVWLHFVYSQPQLLPHLLQRITLIHTTYYPYQTLWCADMVNHYGVKMDNAK